MFKTFFIWHQKARKKPKILFPNNIILIHIFTLLKDVQISIAFRGGYVPDLCWTKNTETKYILGLKQAKMGTFPLFSPILKVSNSQNRK